MRVNETKNDLPHTTGVGRHPRIDSVIAPDASVGLQKMKDVLHRILHRHSKASDRMGAKKPK